MTRAKPNVTVDVALTHKIAGLAKVDLTPQEADLFARQLGEILQYVDQLNAVHVEGVEPLSHPHALETPLREDRAVAFPAGADGAPRVLEAANEVVDSGFKVPPIL